MLASPEDVDILITTREKGRFFLKTSTELGNNEGSAVSTAILLWDMLLIAHYQSITARSRNVFGGAEVLEANMSMGTTTRRSFQGSFSAPLTSNLRTRGEISIFGLHKDLSSFASCTEELRGIKALVRVS